MDSLPRRKTGSLVKHAKRGLWLLWKRLCGLGRVPDISRRWLVVRWRWLAIWRSCRGKREERDKESRVSRRGRERRVLYKSPLKTSRKTYPVVV